jgi:hypothetical protein
MHPWYDYETWSKQRREEALTEARERRLADRACSRWCMELALRVTRYH